MVGLVVFARVRPGATAPQGGPSLKRHLGLKPQA